MDKIICDLCGTSYPDTAAQCPICGTARTDASKQQSADMAADSYAYVRGGRFSKANVRKRTAGQTENRRQSDERRRPAQQAHPAQGRDAKPAGKPQSKAQSQQEESGSNRALGIVVVILLLAIIGICAFIAVKFIQLRDSGYHSGDGTQSTAGSQLIIHCTGLSIDQKELVFNTSHKTVLLQPTLQPADTTDPVSFVSSNPSVVKVDADGLVTPVADGEAEITVSCGRFQVVCKVTCEIGVEPPVTEPPASEPPVSEPPVSEPPVTEPNPPHIVFSLNRVDFTLSGYGASWDLTRNSPDNMGNNYSGPDDPSEIVWSSEDPSIATVENGVVTAVGNGRTNIIAEYNGKTRYCIVRCRNVAEQVTPVEPVYGLNYTDVTVNPGERLPLRLRVLATGAAVQDVIYSVDDDSVCAIDSDGTIEAQASGAGRFTTVRVTYEGETYTCIVRVRQTAPTEE